MRPTKLQLNSVALSGVLLVTMFAFCAPAAAATDTYPGGGSGFDEGGEGWSAGNASCSPGEALCTSEASYDATTGNPPGSLAAKTTVTLNLVSLFKGTAAWNSPKFTVPVGAITDAELRLDHAFMPGGLVDVEPEASYDVTLLDLTSGRSTTALSEELGEGEEAFASASAPVAVVGGHTYRLVIDTETAQSTLALSLTSGTTSLYLDNIGLTVRTASGAGDGSGGKGSLTDRRLFSLLSGGGATGPAVLAKGGKRLLVRVACPAKVGHACRVTAQGMLNRRKPATARRMVKLGKGKAKRIALRVKPKAGKRIAKRKRLLVREKVRAGGARATVYKSRKLIRQG